MKITDTNKLFELGKRVYNGQLRIEADKEGKEIMNDEKAIKALCSSVFEDDGSIKSLDALHSFNNIIVRVADEIAQPRVEEMLKLFANYQKANRGDVVVYKLPKNRNKVTLKWSALGSGVDLQRLNSTKKQVPATPNQLQFGAYYEPIDMVKNSVDAFKESINAVADSKVELYFTKVMELVYKAVNTGTVPAKQVKKGSNLTLKDYQVIENQLIRFGGRPLFFGDFLLINHFAEQQVTDAYYSKLLTDEIKHGLLRDLRATAFSKTIGVNIDNKWIDKDNLKVKFPVNEGYIFAGGAGDETPIYITEFGGMRQMPVQSNVEDERIAMVIKLEVDISLISARTMGFVKDDSVSI